MDGSVRTKTETGTSFGTPNQHSVPQAGTITQCVIPTDEAPRVPTEADLKQRARRQALLLMVASAIVTIALLTGAWLALRRLS